MHSCGKANKDLRLCQGLSSLKDEEQGKKKKKSTIKQKTRTDVSHEADLDREEIHLRKVLCKSVAYKKTAK